MGAQQSTSTPVMEEPPKPAVGKAVDGAKPSSSSPPVSSITKLNIWEDTVREEEAYQAASIPPNEVPGCMKLFDAYFSCNAPGRQIRYVYRRGFGSHCTEKLDDFKFCLTLKSASPEEFRAKWIRHRAERIATKRLQESSEDVWDFRKDPIVDPQFVDPLFPPSPPPGKERA